MEAADPPSRAVRWGGGIAIAGYVAAGILYAASFNTGYALFIAIVCVVLAQGLLTFMHEAGHALAAWLFGWRIILFAARPFVVQFPNRNIAWLRETHEPGIGGMVLAIPRSRRQDTRRASFWLTAGGPLANVIVSLAAFCAAAWVAAFDTRYVLYSHLVFAVGIHSAAMCLMSLLPSALGLWSDGQSLRHQLKPRAGDEAELRVTGYMAAILKYKVRLKAIPEWMLADAREIAAANADVARYLDPIGIGRILDSVPVDAAAARARMGAFEVQYGDSCWLACCDAYLAAISRASASIHSGRALSRTLYFRITLR